MSVPSLLNQLPSRHLGYQAERQVYRNLKLAFHVKVQQVGLSRCWEKSLYCSTLDVQHRHPLKCLRLVSIPSLLNQLPSRHLGDQAERQVYRNLKLAPHVEVE